MSTNEKIKELFAKYIPDMHPVVYDGIVDEACFSAQNEKVLFLLKDGDFPDPYEDGNGYTYLDVQKALIDDSPAKKFYPMWRVMSMWIKTIEDSSCTYESCLNEHGEFDVKNMRGYLARIATVNIKKSPGVGSCPDEKLKEAVATYYPLIKEEIALIKPTLVICGNTFQFIVDQYDVEVHPLPYGSRYFLYDGCAYLDFFHPGYFVLSYAERFDRFKKIYSALCDQLNVK